MTKFLIYFALLFTFYGCSTQEIDVHVLDEPLVQVEKDKEILHEIEVLDYRHKCHCSNGFPVTVRKTSCKKGCDR